MYTTVPTPILVAQPAEPLTLAEAKLFLRVDVPEDDGLIQGLVTAARQWFEAATDRSFVTTSWRLKLPAFSPDSSSGWVLSAAAIWGRGRPGRIDLPNPPLIGVSSVAYLDTGNVSQTLATTVYNVVTSTTPGGIELGWDQVWPVTLTHPEAVTISYTGGYGAAGDVPELVKAGIKLLLAHWYDHRGDTAEVPKAVEAIATAAGAKRF